MVSIPFKREGVSKRYEGGMSVAKKREFLFPSSGKAFPNTSSVVTLPFLKICSVSIPFKREGVSKPIMMSTAPAWRRRCFYSLQPGRRFQTSTNSIVTTVTCLCFYSLQPGRRFQTHNVYVDENPTVSFYSLQPGRRFQTFLLSNLFHPAVL